MRSEEKYKCTYECFGMPRITRKPMCVADPVAQRNAMHPTEDAKVGEMGARLDARTISKSYTLLKLVCVHI